MFDINSGDIKMNQRREGRGCNRLVQGATQSLRKFLKERRMSVRSRGNTFPNHSVKWPSAAYVRSDPPKVQHWGREAITEGVVSP